MVFCVGLKYLIGGKKVIAKIFFCYYNVSFIIINKLKNIFFNYFLILKKIFYEYWIV